MGAKPGHEDPQYTFDMWWDDYRIPVNGLFENVDAPSRLMADFILDRLLSGSTISERMRVVATGLLASLIADGRHTPSGPLATQCQEIAETIINDILEGSALPPASQHALTSVFTALLYDNYVRAARLEKSWSARGRRHDW